MIKIKIDYNDNYIKNIKVSGHANYDVHGKDIVCASVSSMVITSVNLAMKYNASSVKVNQGEGLIDVNVLIEDEVINLIFSNLKDMLEELSNDYEKNVKII
jgi:uncharacterized protein YsxB (DUF464 family)